MLEPTDDDLRAISDALEDKSPQEILEWTVRMFAPKVTMATAFGAEGCIILSMLADIRPRIRVFNLDTGYQFAETLRLRDRFYEKYGIEVEYVRADETVASMERRFNGPIYTTRSDECCRIRKVVPLAKAVKGYDAWISAIRRDQTSDRKQSGIVEWDKKFRLLKINPLANWSKDRVWRYIHENDVPYNPLHDQGYPSIGCRPCTLPVTAGQSDRAGRWSGTGRLECGLHSR